MQPRKSSASSEWFLRDEASQRCNSSICSVHSSFAALRVCLYRAALGHDATARQQLGQALQACVERKCQSSIRGRGLSDCTALHMYIGIVLGMLTMREEEFA